MRNIFIVSVFILGVCFEAVAQNNWDALLDEYDRICSQCLELRSSVVAGKSVSQSSVLNLLNQLSQMKARLQKSEGSMTAQQKDRFKAIRNSYSAAIGRPSSSAGTAVSVPVSATVSVSASVPKPAARVLVRDTIAVTDTVFKTVLRLDTIIISGAQPVKDIERPIRIVKQKPDIRWNALLQAGYDRCIVGGASISFTVNRWGMKLSAASSFTPNRGTYFCNSQGVIAGGGYFWANGAKSISSWNITCGPMWNASRMIGIFAEAGFGRRTVNWQDTDGKWATVTDLSRSGLAANAGIMLHFQRLVLSASCLYNGSFAPVVGVGVSF